MAASREGRILHLQNAQRPVIIFLTRAARHASERFPRLAPPDRSRRGHADVEARSEERRRPHARAMGRRNGRKAKGARRAGEAADDEASDGESGGAIDAASLTPDDGPEATCAVATDEVTLELPGDDGTLVGTPDDTRGAVAGGWRGFFGGRARGAATTAATPSRSPPPRDRAAELLGRPAATRATPPRPSPLANRAAAAVASA